MKLQFFESAIFFLLGCGFSYESLLRTALNLGGYGRVC